MTEQNTLAQVLDGMTVADLRAYADKNDVDLTGLSRKADIVQAIASSTSQSSDDAGTAGASGGDDGRDSAGADSPGYYGDVTETRLDTDVSKPSTVAPGDAPADTTDPTEEASTVNPDKAAAAMGGHGTVNTVVPIRRPRAKASKAEDRIERYEATRPNGEVVLVEHNIDKGTTEVVGLVSPAPARV